MNFKQLVLGPFQTNCYIINADSGKTILIDPAWSAVEILKNLKKLDYIIITHMHWDHVGALYEVKQHFPNAKICVSKKETADPNKTLEKMGITNMPYIKIPQTDIYLSEGDFVDCFEVLETPGHTDGSICLYTKKNNILFCGDTIFRDGLGRTDIDGNYSVLMNSIKKILSLDGKTIIYSGHGETTTVEHERLNNN